MTRNEAVKKILANMPTSPGFAGDLVKTLEALGLLHLETTEDTVRVEAADRLTLSHTYVIGDRATEHAAKITRAGAFEIIDVLLKSGFRITRDG